MKQVKLKRDLFVLILGLLIFNFHLLNPRFVFVGDAFFNLNFYYFIYNNLFFKGQLAEWVPYGTYGMPVGIYQLTEFGPMSYLTMFVGYIFKVKHVLWLFKATLLGEQLIFLLGMYLLGGLLFKRHSTVFWVCLCATGMNVCYTQLAFNFHVYYLFPLVAYLWLLFFLKKTPGPFWLGCLVCLLWLMSCPGYFAGLILYVMFFFSIVFFLKDKKIWKTLFSSVFSHRGIFLLFFILLGIYVYSMKNSLNFTALISPSRTASGRVNLDTFLTYGGKSTVPMLIRSFFFANPAYLQVGSLVDNTVYISLAALVFFAWAVLRVRERVFFAFLIPVIALVWLSFGGIFARTVYYFFPFMSYYRHIGLSLSLAKILMLISAGFGFENFLSIPLKKKAYYLFLIFALIVFLFNSNLQSPAGAQKLWYFTSGLEDSSSRGLFTHELFRFGVYLVFSFVGVLACFFIFMAGWLRKKTSRTIFGHCALACLMLACFFDLLSFQQVAVQSIPRSSLEHYDSFDSLLVNKLEFQEERFFLNVFNPPKKHLSERQLHALKLFDFSKTGEYYATDCNFIQFDPLTSDFNDNTVEEGQGRLCVIQGRDYPHALSLDSQWQHAIHDSGSDFRTDLIMRNVHNLRQVKRKDKKSSIVFGGYYHKLRLVPNAYFVKNSEEALNAAATLPNIINTVVLTRRKDAEPFWQGPANSMSGNLGEVKVLDFSANELLAKVSVNNPNGAWLVYADSYHPGWHAVVNGRAIPVYEAYGAFKAVYLKPQDNEVKFFFFNGLGSVCSYIIALFNLTAAALLVFVVLKTLLVFEGKSRMDLLGNECS